MDIRKVVVPNPSHVNSDRSRYASFSGWVQMKLVANREKDRYRIIETLQRAPDHQIVGVISRGYTDWMLNILLRETSFCRWQMRQQQDD